MKRTRKPKPSAASNIPLPTTGGSFIYANGELTPNPDAVSTEPNPGKTAAADAASADGELGPSDSAGA